MVPCVDERASIGRVEDFLDQTRGTGVSLRSKGLIERRFSIAENTSMGHSISKDRRISAFFLASCIAHAAGQG